MNEDKLGLAADIDVSESGSEIYQCVAGELKLVEKPWQRADWGAETWQENLTMSLPKQKRRDIWL
ncbi:MAG: hypothetical protein R3A44_30515 [Caldilineaceae bacterium]